MAAARDLPKVSSSCTTVVIAREDSKKLPLFDAGAGSPTDYATY
jgi:hypothetical protein